MPKHIIYSFNAGELSPNLYGRTDFQKYFSGCKTLENFIPLPYGGVQRRSGTQYINSTKSNGQARLIAFQFNVEQAYVLEFGNLYMRVYKNGAVVESAPGVPFELVTTYATADLNTLRFIQSADVLFVAHSDYPPKRISRTADTTWTIEDIDFIGGPFLDSNIDPAITLTLSFPKWATGTDYVIGDEVYVLGTVDYINASGNAVDNGLGFVGIPVTGHAFVYGDLINISGSTNYDGNYRVESTTSTNIVVIRAAYVAEVFAGTEKIRTTDYYSCIKDHTSTTGGAHPTPPGNVTDWYATDEFTGFNGTLTASSALFDDPNHVGSLWELRHPRDNNTVSGSFASVTQSRSIAVSGDMSWDFVTHGTWTGTIELIRSYDNGLTWSTYKSYTSVADRNVLQNGEETDDVLIKVSMSAYTSGTCTYDFTVNEYETVGIVELTDITSTKIATARVIKTVGSLDSTYTWAEGAFSAYRGYPSVLSFHEERLVFASTPSQPQTLWFSVINEWNNFTSGVNDDDAMTYTIAHDQVNSIRWIQSHNDLLIGTSGGEWKMSGTNNDVITPTNVYAHIQSTNGSNTIDANVVNSVVLFTTRNSRKLRELVYSFEKDSYIAPDLTRLAEHITQGGLSEVIYQQSPESIVWAIRSDGVLLGMSYEREEDVIAWHKHDLNGVVESIARIQGEDEDELWMIVNRTIDGGTTRYIERKKPQYFESVEDCWFVDSGIEVDNGTTALKVINATNSDPLTIETTNSGDVDALDGKFVKITNVEGMTEINGGIYKCTYDSIPYTYNLTDETDTFGIDSTNWSLYESGGDLHIVQKEVTGLDHLEGEEVVIFADGATHANKTVDSGSITLNVWVNKVIVGFGMTSTLSPMEVEIPDQSGSTGQGAMKRINKLYLRFIDSIHCQAGSDEDHLETVYFRTPSDPMNSGIPLFSGDKELYFNGDYTRNPNIVIQQSLPLPLNLIAMIIEAKVTK